MGWRSNVARACATLFAMAVIVSGCGDDEGEVAGTDDAAQNEPANEKSAVAPDMSVVVLGDSIPYNSPEDCSGCVGFADSYGEALGEELGEPVGVKNLSRHDGARTRDIVDQLTSGELTEPLASADVVILSVGLNDQPPYVYRDQPCRADEPATDAEAIDAVTATTLECVDTMTDTLQRTMSRGLSEVRAQAPDAAVAALVPYDTWNGWKGFDGIRVVKGRSALRVVTYALDTWRTALCAAVALVDGECVDLYGAFNGSNGRQPAGDLLASDYTHPSQQGNDLIRDLLLSARLLG